MEQSEEVKAGLADLRARLERMGVKRFHPIKGPKWYETSPEDRIRTTNEVLAAIENGEFVTPFGDRWEPDILPEHFKNKRAWQWYVFLVHQALYKMMAYAYEQPQWIRVAYRKRKRLQNGNS